MPRVEVPATSGNLKISTLLGSQAPQTGFAAGLTYQADSDNGDALKIGGSSMTATDYDFELSAGDSADDGGPVMLQTRYVRNDSASAQHLIIRFRST